MVKGYFMEKHEITILLVEDSPIAQFAAAAVITQSGYKVELASTGKEALDKLAQTKYDLILMDIGLPDSSGLAVTEIVRSKEGPNRDAPIIALTSHVENAYHNQAEWVGMNDFLEKPLTAEKLAQMVNAYINSAEAVSQNRLVF